MPFKSKAQRRKFAQLLVEGEITPEVFEEWNRETGGAHLPERVSKKTTRQKPSVQQKRGTPAKRKRKASSRAKTPTRRKTRTAPARKKRAVAGKRSRR